MKRSIEDVDHRQATFFREYLEDWIDEDNPVRVIDVFVAERERLALGIDRALPNRTGRPPYHLSIFCSCTFMVALARY